MISNNVGILTSVDLDEPMQRRFQLRTPNDIRSVDKQT